MEEKNISPEESLHIIQKMIENSRMKLAENGFHLLVWGYLIIVASILQYLSIVFRLYVEKSWIIWIVATIIALSIGFIYEKNRKDISKIKKNKVNNVINNVWQSFGISAFLVMLFCIKFEIYNVTILILISLGAASFVSGKILEFKPLIFGGIIFWIGCVACLFLREESLLVNALLMFLGFIIPGNILWKRYKKENKDV